MKKICLSLLIFFTFCGAAAAHIIYTTQDGYVGLIAVSSATDFELSSKQYSGNANSILATYWENNTSNGDGNSKIILITPKEEGNPTTSGDTAVRFSSAAALTSPIDDANNPIVLKDSYGEPVVCGTNNGGSLYLATGNTLREYRTASFNLRHSYAYSSSDLAPNPEIKALLRNDYRVYALVGLNNGVSEDIFVTLDGTLTATAVSAITNLKNSNTMNYIANAAIIAGCDDGPYSISGSVATSLVSTDAVVAIQADTGTGFYFLTKNEDKNEVSLYHYTATDTKPTPKTFEGSGAAFAKDPTYNILGVIAGTKILLLNMEDDEILETYEAANLGGTPISITASSTTGQSNDNGSSGFMLSGASLAMMFALSIAMKYKKERI